MENNQKILDAVEVEIGKGVQSKVVISGEIIVELFDENKNLKERQIFHNLVTANGDQYCAKKLYSAPTAMAGMKLGGSATAASKTGAASFAGTGDYIAGTAHAFDATFPKQGATADIAQYKTTWAAGEGTATGINSVSIVDNTTDAVEADATHTLARATFTSAINKGVSDTLAVTWNITFLGA